MDNLTHACLGLGVYGTYVAATGHPIGGAVGWAACAAAVIGAEAPDVDIVARIFGDPVTYLYQHRQVSHSVPFWFAYSLIIGGALSFWAGGHALLLVTLAFLGVLTHIGSDMLTTYGTKALWPLTGRRFRGDSLFVGEPIFIVLALIGIVLYRQGVPLQSFVFALDAIALVYTCWRVLLHQFLLRRLRLALPSLVGTATAETCRIRVTPMLLPIPQAHKYVIVNDQRYWFGSFTAGGRPVPEAEVISDATPAVFFALQNSRVGRAMAWFTPMLVAKQEQEGQLTIVRLADAGVRYFDTLLFSAAIDLATTHDGSYALVHEGLRAQSMHIRRSFSDGWQRLGRRMRLTIASPKGYRSGR
ncbi:hypothetical protein Heshes_09470 [Alicyclobacillus hesperidum]|uniref:Inner membrane protein n=1 Tax=Alicyclobacillus hesperidum TaxID=89784 RepID=A0AA37U195_9BACL|nr:metal-dependent hydrolase [Alicyclobacillus hesperidum]GLV13263.1 hypothetical protein Heshes_09470 [Alicyclobacillus hesperidum]